MTDLQTQRQDARRLLRRALANPQADFHAGQWEAIDAASIRSGPVLLVDDLVDSAWTLTVVAALLRQAGSGPVWPTALATTASGGD